MSWFLSMLVLGVLVMVHELGHFVVARWFGVTVERFAIGFGPKIFGWTRGSTEYCLRLFPLGGYVKLAGEQKVEQGGKPDEFSAKPISVRATIVAAGPIVNYLSSVIALFVVLIIGYPELLPEVGRVVEKMPAQVAGLKEGDKVLTINGTRMATWEELTQQVHEGADKTLVFHVQRGAEQLDVPVTPKAQDITDPFGRRQSVGLIGIAPSGAFGTYKVGPGEAVKLTFEKQAEWTKQIFLSLWSLFRGRVKFQESFTGPIGIIYMTAEATRMGWGPLLYLVSILSLSLALFNFFPIPILDGGHLLYLFIEKLRGKAVSLTAQERAARVSFALMLALLALVCVNDFNRFGLVDKIRGLWKP